ncbi:MAG: response regulator, partial [Dehalococcoidia bacterium]
ELITEWLFAEGFSVVQASDGLQAQREIEARTYDCVLLDLRMPGLSGIELYRWMRQRESSLTDRVVFITGDTISSETDKFLRQTENPVLSKPFTSEDLKLKLGKVLASSNWEQGQ